MGCPITILGYDLENVEVIDIPSPRPIEGGGAASMQECSYGIRDLQENNNKKAYMNADQ